MSNIQIVGLADSESFPDCPTMFSEITVTETLVIPDHKPEAEQIVEVLVDVTTKRTRLISTPVGTSESGLCLTGHKLVVEGNVDEKITYVAAEPSQPVHAIEGSLPFSTFIIVPSSVHRVPIHDLSDELMITPYVEDVSVDLVSPREVFTNVLLFLDASLTLVPHRHDKLRSLETVFKPQD